MTVPVTLLGESKAAVITFEAFDTEVYSLEMLPKITYFLKGMITMFAFYYLITVVGQQISLIGYFHVLSELLVYLTTLQVAKLLEELILLAETSSRNLEYCLDY